MQVGSLFSGVGLCDLGLEWAGMGHAFFCEVDPFCRSVLRRHWPGIPIYEDIRELRGADLPPVDVLCGGFPCQDVSLAAAGKRKGITGKRSGLWHEYARLIEEIRPGYVIVENVPGLLAAGVEAVLQDLAEIGYDAEWVLYGFLLPAERGGGLYAPARPGVTEDSFARRYLWLRELGLLREELTMVDFGISNAERDWLTERGVTVCAPEKLAERMGEKTT